MRNVVYYSMDLPRPEVNRNTRITIVNSREFHDKPYALDNLAGFMASTSQQEHVTSGGVANLSKEQAARNLVEGHTYVAMTEGRPVGYLNMVPGPSVEGIPSCWLNGFFVLSSERGQGIGGQLWEQACRAHQDEFIYLDTMNSTVKKLAEASRFVTDEQFRGRRRLENALNMAQLVAHPRDYLWGVAKDVGSSIKRAFFKESSPQTDSYAMYVRFPSTW